MKPMMRLRRFEADKRRFWSWRAAAICVGAPLGLCLPANQALASPPAPDGYDGQTSLPSRVSVSAGVNVWDGKFGAKTATSITTALLGVRYQADGLRLSASIPYMRIRSDGTFFAGIGGTPLFVAPQVRSVRRVRKDFGDVTLGASCLLPWAEGRSFELEVSGRVKIPTASSDSQLSTRKVDYSAGGQISKTIGRITPSFSATYRVFGDSAQWKFNNGWDMIAGASYAVTSKTVAILSYEFVQKSSRLIRNSHELLSGFSTPVASNKMRLSGYVAKGLSGGAANISGGLALALTL